MIDLGRVNSSQLEEFKQTVERQKLQIYRSPPWVLVGGGVSFFILRELIQENDQDGNVDRQKHFRSLLDWAATREIRFAFKPTEALTAAFFMEPYFVGFSMATGVTRGVLAHELTHSIIRYERGKHERDLGARAYFYPASLRQPRLQSEMSFVDVLEEIEAWRVAGEFDSLPRSPYEMVTKLYRRHFGDALLDRFMKVWPESRLQGTYQDWIQREVDRWSGKSVFEVHQELQTESAITDWELQVNFLIKLRSSLHLIASSGQKDEIQKTLQRIQREPVDAWSARESMDLSRALDTSAIASTHVFLSQKVSLRTHQKSAEKWLKNIQSRYPKLLISSDLRDFLFFASLFPEIPRSEIMSRFEDEFSIRLQFSPQDERKLAEIDQDPVAGFFVQALTFFEKIQSRSMTDWWRVFLDEKSSEARRSLESEYLIDLNAELWAQFLKVLFETPHDPELLTFFDSTLQFFDFSEGQKAQRVNRKPFSHWVNSRVADEIFARGFFSNSWATPRVRILRRLINRFHPDELPSVRSWMLSVATGEVAETGPQYLLTNLLVGGPDVPQLEQDWLWPVILAASLTPRDNPVILIGVLEYLGTRYATHLRLRRLLSVSDVLDDQALRRARKEVQKLDELRTQELKAAVQVLERIARQPSPQLRRAVLLILSLVPAYLVSFENRDDMDLSWVFQWRESIENSPRGGDCASLLANLPSEQ